MNTTTTYNSQVQYSLDFTMEIGPSRQKLISLARIQFERGVNLYSWAKGAFGDLFTSYDAGEYVVIHPNGKLVLICIIG